MNPQYKVQITVTLNHPVAAKSIDMQQIRYLPFVPCEGQTLRITSEDGEYKIDLTMASVVYDTEEHMFVCLLEDDKQIETYREDSTCNTSDLVADYVSFGFQRITYPQGQVVRHEPQQ